MFLIELVWPNWTFFQANLAFFPKEVFPDEMFLDRCSSGDCWGIFRLRIPTRRIPIRLHIGPEYVPRLDLSNAVGYVLDLRRPAT
jgi:hypothetical protein